MKRGAPRTGSIPTMAMSRPSKVMMSAASTERPDRLVTRDRPTTSRANTSGGPKRRARLASGSDTTMSASVANVPPMKEPMAAIPRAGPLALAWPSDSRPDT